MGKKIDLTGQRFGKLVVVSESQERKNGGSVQWKCRCDCGGIKITSSNVLRQGRCKSCGCLNVVDITGEKFGKLIAICDSGKRNKHGNAIWKCVCECGSTKYSTVANLNQGKTKSCGCILNENLRGKKTGHLTAVSETGRRRANGSKIWKCICDCGKYTEVSSSDIRLMRIKSCGCLMFGEKHHNYNPELTAEDRLSMRYDLQGNDQHVWRKEIFSSDDFTCQSCNRRGSDLNAHHLNSWNAFPEQRFDTANGITLCEDCHKEYHYFNGYGDNTLEEFRDHLACLVGEEHISEIEETLLSRESEIIGQEVEQKETRELQTT